MAFTPVPGSTLGFSGIGLAVILAVFVRNDPPIVVWDGSIHAKTDFWHIWHQVEDSGQSFSLAPKRDKRRSTDNDMPIVIRDSKKKTLLDCTASQWVVSLYTERDGTNPVAQLCANHQCDAKARFDGDGNIYFNSSQSGKRLRRTWGMKWWEIEYEDDDMHINKVELKTAGPNVEPKTNGPATAKACPASWPNASSPGVPDYYWQVQIGKFDKSEERSEER